jgi:hypothetical protein
VVGNYRRSIWEQGEEGVWERIEEEEEWIVEGRSWVEKDGKVEEDGDWVD